MDGFPHETLVPATVNEVLIVQFDSNGSEPRIRPREQSYTLVLSSSWGTSMLLERNGRLVLPAGRHDLHVKLETNVAIETLLRDQWLNG